MAIGIALFSCILIFGELSGGHFNPAVTLGVFIKEGVDKMQQNALFALKIILSQIFGMALAALIIYPTIMPTQIDVPNLDNTGTYKDLRGNFETLCPVNNLYDHMSSNIRCTSEQIKGIVYLVEFICTFIFVCVYLNIKYINGANQSAITNAASIGIIYAAMRKFSFKITGGCFNPALGLTQPILQMIIFSNTEIENSTLTSSLDTMFIYITSPLVGGIAAGLFSTLNSKLVEQQKQSMVQ